MPPSVCGSVSRAVWFLFDSEVLPYLSGLVCILPTGCLLVFDLRLMDRQMAHDSTRQRLRSASGYGAVFGTQDRSISILVSMVAERRHGPRHRSQAADNVLYCVPFMGKDGNALRDWGHAKGRSLAHLYKVATQAQVVGLVSPKTAEGNVERR